MGQHPLRKKEEMLHQAPIRHSFGFRAFMDHVAASCLAGSIISRQNSRSAELFPCSSQLQHVSNGLWETPHQGPVPLPSFRGAHSVEIIVIIILGAWRCPLSWMLYKCMDNDSLCLKHL